MALASDFEGKFDLQTSGGWWRGGKANMEWHAEDHVRDPAEQGRERAFTYDKKGNARSHKTGRIYWGAPGDEERGAVTVRTTSKDVTLLT